MGEEPKDEPIDVLCQGAADASPSCPLGGYSIGVGLKYVIRGSVADDEVIDMFTLDNNGSGIVSLFRGARCGENGLVVHAEYWKNVVGVIRLETGGFFCQNG